MKIKYRIKLLNDFEEPYWASDNVQDAPSVIHRNMDEYIVYDEKVFRSILDEFLDAPKKKLTEKEVRKDFDDEMRVHRLSKERVNAIMAYYNGRLALKNKVYSDLANIDTKKMKKDFPVVLKYCIPFEMNYFSCEDNDPCDKLTKMNDAFIEVEVSREE